MTLSANTLEFKTMTYQTFTFNVESAKKADSEGGRINKTDKYIGTITRAEFVTSKGGAQGLEFYFATDDKQETNFTIWTQGKDGSALFGVDKVNAILACTRTKQLTPTQATVEKYSFEEKKDTQQQVVIAPELQDKRVGLLLQAEEYYNANNDVKVRMNFVASFDASSQLMAKELIEKKTAAEALPKAYERLMKQGDKKVEPAYSYDQAGTYGANPNAPQDLDDDLPF